MSAYTVVKVGLKTTVAVGSSQATVVRAAQSATVVTKLVMSVPGPSPIWISDTPPSDTSMLWVDTTL